MITTYRIAQTAYIPDLSSYGAYLYGGRWNLPGTYALYLASHRSLAYMEFLVHQFSREIWPGDLMLASIRIRNERLVTELTSVTLPANWASMKYDVEVQRTTTRLFNPLVLGIKVPSVVVPGEFNYVLNPKYPGFEKEVFIEGMEPADFDKRLKPV